MKTFTKFWVLMAMAMLTFSFTSCDDDDEIAYTLEGTWQGNMYVSTYYNDRYYDASYTEVYFERDPYRYSSGVGYWVDYYNDYYWGGYNYVASHIEWTVNNRTIKIYFVEDNETVYIDNYRLSDNYFNGEISWRDGTWNQFSLRHVSSPNWGRIDHWGYGDYYDPYYYSNGSSIQDDPDLVKTDGTAASTAKGNAPKRVFRTNPQ